MAKLYRRSVGPVTLRCYSERGIMSFFMFRVLVAQMPEFLGQTSFAKFVPNRLKEVSQPESVTLFSELGFGNRGFGNPDGAIWFRDNGKPILILMEVKLNQSYRGACSLSASYNSTIQGQLELKWRLMQLYKNGFVQDVNDVNYVIENDPMIEFYKSKDHFYSGCANVEALPRKKRRRLKLVAGVREFFQAYVDRCELKDIYYLTLTNDETNPFDSGDKFIPRCCDKDGNLISASLNQFAWMNTTVLEGCQETNCSALGANVTPPG